MYFLIRLCFGIFFNVDMHFSTEGGGNTECRLFGISKRCQKKRQFLDYENAKVSVLFLGILYFLWVKIFEKIIDNSAFSESLKPCL